MKILVTGGGGKLGSKLAKTFPNALLPTKRKLDITRYKKVSTYLEKNEPDLIVHAAAVASVGKCEQDKKLAWRTNYQGTVNLLRAAENIKTTPYFIYISTACVFYGDSSYYTEEDLPYPKNFYGLTKLLGETAVRNSSLKKRLIARTNFASKEPWPYPAAFTDRYATYLFANDVAMAIKELVEAKKTGVVHVCGDKKMSMYELAKMVSPKVKKITLKNYEGPPLTVNMSLDTKRWKKYKISAP